MSSSDKGKILILDGTSGETSVKSFKEHCEDPVNRVITDFKNSIVTRNGNAVDLTQRYVTLKGGDGHTHLPYTNNQNYITGHTNMRGGNTVMHNNKLCFRKSGQPDLCLGYEDVKRMRDRSNNALQNNHYVAIMNNNAGCRSLVRHTGSPAGDGKIHITHGRYCGSKTARDEQKWYLRQL